MTRHAVLPALPACWSWTVTAEHLAAVASCPENHAHLMLWNWQQGRCAACARPALAGRPLVRDHDHVTGLIRGLLCQRCNVGEGHTATGLKRPVEVFDRYRERHPSLMIALTARHVITSGPWGSPLPASFVSPVLLPALASSE
ncbi:MAG: endonuclease domain-containing protein [Actinophytocola sp.]|uniref:endonuclease domain-containing protein n=1 Tax=Actinophytocola sp. TaxID=1872138 RepID=UPI003C732845